VHVPEPLHVEVVSSPPAHDVAQVVVLPGNTHAPLALHPVAPHVPPVGEHAAVQQLPVPEIPQTMLAHASLLVHVPVELRAWHVPPVQ
jgi:hypothetical protein